MADWIIHTTDSASIIAEFATNTPNELNLIEKGGTATYTFGDVRTKLTVESGETYTVPSGETQEWDIVIVKGTLDVDGTILIDELTIDGGTIDNDGTVDVNEKYAFEISEVQKYSPFVGQYSINETLTGTQKYREQLPSTAGIDTLLVGIEPGSDLASDDVEGYWGLLRNVTDERNTPLSNVRVSLEIDVLAPYSNYADHTAVQNALET